MRSIDRSFVRCVECCLFGQRCWFVVGFLYTTMVLYGMVWYGMVWCGVVSIDRSSACLLVCSLVFELFRYGFGVRSSFVVGTVVCGMCMFLEWSVVFRLFCFDGFRFPLCGMFVCFDRCLFVRPFVLFRCLDTAAGSQLFQFLCSVKMVVLVFVHRVRP